VILDNASHWDASHQEPLPRLPSNDPEDLILCVRSRGFHEAFSRPWGSGSFRDVFLVRLAVSTDLPPGFLSRFACGTTRVGDFTIFLTQDAGANPIEVSESRYFQGIHMMCIEHGVGSNLSPRLNSFVASAQGKISPTASGENFEKDTDLENRH